MQQKLQTYLSRLLSPLLLFIGMVGVVSVLPASPAPAQPQQAQCTINGKKGVYVAIAINGQHCIPVETGTDVNANPIFKFFISIIQFFSVGVGVAVVGGVVWGGILYITARANASQTEKGRLVILNAMIGLFLYIFMFAIINFLIPGGIFQ